MRRTRSPRLKKPVLSAYCRPPFENRERWGSLSVGCNGSGKIKGGPAPDTQDILAQGDCCFDTPNRELSANQGRWLTPDPAGSGWNQYAYATNPNSFIDPTGLQLCAPGCGGCTIDGCGSNASGVGGGGAGDSADCSAEFSDCSGSYIDGILAPASTVQMLLTLGWAAPCPNGNCSGFAINGVLSYYDAYETGSTYAPYAGPNSLFDTHDEALTAGAMYAMDETLLNAGNEQDEYCGATYGNGNGGFSYTAGQPGSAGVCGALQFMAAELAVPEGDAWAGFYHSHDALGSAADRFSVPGDLTVNGVTPTGDTGFSQNQGLPLSVATPNGNVIIYYPASGCQVFAIGAPAAGTQIPTC